MILVRKQNQLEQLVTQAHLGGKTVGLVPTMGGLHDGHLSLVSHCKKDCDVTVVSLFLNPTQFNDKKDLITYPHDPEADQALLEKEGVDIVFAPSPSEMYAEGEVAPQFDLGRVAEVMEGAHRPGHFAGVTWIVSKLFRLVRPDKAYFGEKDFQQIAVIKRMIAVSPDMQDITIVPCPVVRESDGLAMSSRNTRLSSEEREAAPLIYQSLVMGVQAYRSGLSVTDVQRLVIDRIDAHPLLKTEYFSIVDSETLEEVTQWQYTPDVVGCITVFCGEVRLIDHIHFG